MKLKLYSVIARRGAPKRPGMLQRPVGKLHIFLYFISLFVKHNKSFRLR